MPAELESQKRQCTLLLFVAIPAEEEALEKAAKSRGIVFETVIDSRLKDYGWGEYYWLGAVGSETVIAVGPTREKGNRGALVMGALGRLGIAAKALRFQEATGAKGIVQLGMAFGIDPKHQNLGDVLVSSSLIPYDNRDIKPHPNDPERYVTHYSQLNTPHSNALARKALVDLFEREKKRGGRAHSVHVGPLLSGAARIHCRAFRDELVKGFPSHEIVGGEMEGVGLLAASTAADDPIWCVVKGVSDFADENRDEDVKTGRLLACRNAAEFVLSALLNDTKV